MFSKFLHGTAVLYPERCLEAPYWFLPAEGGTLSPATYDEMTETADVYLKVSFCLEACASTPVRIVLYSLIFMCL